MTISRHPLSVKYCLNGSLITNEKQDLYWPSKFLSQASNSNLQFNHQKYVDSKKRKLEM